MLLFLAFLSCMAGYLMSKPSFIGRVGMDLFYQQYRILKIWWQGALVVFIVLSILFLIQAIVHHRIPFRKAILVHVLLIITGIAGFVLTYQDFHSSTTHRWLKERFHLGAYLFWLGWIASCSFYFFYKNKPIDLYEKKRGDISL